LNLHGKSTITGVSAAQDYSIRLLACRSG
jgi:hypothetical protein